MDLSTVEQVVSTGAGIVSIAAAAIRFGERWRRPDKREGRRCKRGRREELPPTI
jgi:hypothetical protein